MVPHPNALEQCFDQVTSGAPLALERCLDHVVAALQQAEGNSPRLSDRTELGEAWRELLAHKASWCRRYPDELRAAFRSAGQDKPTSTFASLPSSIEDVMQLSLVDDADMVQAIETSRLVQNVMPLLETPVSELDALVSSAMGLETVQAERNPVRPEVFAQTLRGLVGRTQVKPSTGSLWMKYMAEPLGVELQQLYGRLVKQLKDANVAGRRLWQDARLRSRPARSAESDGFAQTESPSQDESERATWPSAYGTLTSRQISRALLKDFLFRGGGAQAIPGSVAGLLRRGGTRTGRPAAPSRAQAERAAAGRCADRLSRDAVGRAAVAAGRRPEHAQLRGLGRLRRFA